MESTDPPSKPGYCVLLGVPAGFICGVTIWRLVATLECDSSSIYCPWSILTFVLVSILGCSACAYAIKVNMPEFRFHRTSKVHHRGMQAPWSPDSQIAISVTTPVIFVGCAVLWPLAYTTDTDLALRFMVLWSSALGAVLVFVTFMVSYNPSDGIDVEDLVRLGLTPRFDQYCLECNKVYLGEYRYHCRSCPNPNHDS